MRVVSANTQFAAVRFFLCFFFVLFVTRTGRTGRPSLTIYTSYDVFPQLGCDFSVLRWCLPFRGVICPQKLFYGVDRQFQKIRMMLWNTTSIPTNFCTTIKTSKCSLWVVQTRVQQIKMPYGRHIESLINRHIFSTVWLIAGKFETVTHSEHDSPLKIRTLEIPDGGQPPSWKRKNYDISVMVWPIAT